MDAMIMKASCCACQLLLIAKHWNTFYFSKKKRQELVEWRLTKGAFRISCQVTSTQTFTRIHTHAMGQLLKQLIRSVSSFGPAGGGLHKMVRPDIVTSWQLSPASLAGTGPKPKNEWPGIGWIHDWNPEHQVQAIWARCHVRLWYCTLRR